MSFLQDDQDDIVVKGDDGTAEGAKIEMINTDGVRRLAVDARATLGSAPADPIVYRKEHLIDGGTKNMNVDGSVTSVVFEQKPAAGEVWYMDQIVWTMLDNGNNDHNGFGALMELTNGVNIDFIIDGTTYNYKTIKNNGEIVSTFTSAQFIGDANGFLHTANFYVGLEQFKDEITLKGDNGDCVRATIQDDLTGLVRLEMEIRYWHKI